MPTETHNSALPPPQARILLVDDHPILRDGLAQVIANAPDLAVCGQAATDAEALAAIESSPPDLAVVDIFLESSNGIELTKIIRERWPRVKVLILSMHDEMVYALRAHRAGAKGYVMKQEVSATILTAIRSVLAGERHFSPDVEAAIRREAAEGRDRPEPENVLEVLTDRELEVFELFGRGLTRTEIAARIKVSVKTVEAHREHIKEKLKLRDATDLIRRAMLWVEVGRRKA
jgi:DNA-binding NarL/FixJ family response regulator